MDLLSWEAGNVEVKMGTPPSIGFSRQEYWSGLPFPSPGDLPDPGIKPRSSALQADSLLSEPSVSMLNTAQHQESVSYLSSYFSFLESNPLKKVIFKKLFYR